MPAIELPNGASAIIASREELSERANREIARSLMLAGATASKLVALGFDENDATTWNKWYEITPEEQDAVNGFEVALIVQMVKSWSLGELPTSSTVLDLPKPIFDALAKACSIEYSNNVDFSPDGAIDPKADTEGLVDSRPFFVDETRK